MNDEWKSVESVAKNDKGEYMALVGGQWIPAKGGAKNDQGQYMAYGFEAPSAPKKSAPVPEKSYLEQAWETTKKEVPEAMKAMAKAPASVLSGMVGSTAGDIAGVATGKQPLVERIKRSLSYDPNNPYAQMLGKTLGLPAAGWSQMGELAREKLSEAGHPEAGTRVGSALSLVPQAVGARLGKEAAAPIMAERAAEKAATTAERAPQIETAQMVKDLGLKVAPAELSYGKPGLMARELTSLTKKDALHSNASVHNANQVTQLVRDEFDIPRGTPLTRKTFDDIIKKEGDSSYEPIKNYDKPFVANQDYLNSIRKIAGDYTETARKFPEAMGMPKADPLIRELSKDSIKPKESIELIKRLRERSKLHLDKAMGGNVAELEMGKVYRRASDAIENLVADNLASYGDKQLYDNFVNSRKKIAAAYDARSAVHEGSGTIEPAIIGRLFDEEAPLSGNLEKIGRVASTYPEYFRPLHQEAGKVTGNSVTAWGAGTEFIGLQPLLRAILLNQEIPWKNVRK